jgi:hypothetical protein
MLSLEIWVKQNFQTFTSSAFEKKLTGCLLQDVKGCQDNCCTVLFGMELGSQWVVIYSGTISGPGTSTCGMKKFSEKHVRYWDSCWCINMKLRTHENSVCIVYKSQSLKLHLKSGAAPIFCMDRIVLFSWLQEQLLYTLPFSFDNQ